MTKWRITCLGIIGSALLTGCKKPEPPPPPPPAPPAPPPPTAIDVDPIAQTLDLDPRVQYAASLQFLDENLAAAALQFADALARGDEDAFRAKLSPQAAGVLDELVASGEWFEATTDIEAVRLFAAGGDGTLEPNLIGAFGSGIAVAVQDPGGAYVLGWSTSGFGQGSFTSVPVTDQVRPRASDWDGTPIIALAPAMFGFDPATTGGAPLPGLDGDDAPASGARTPQDNSGGGKKVNTPHGPVTIPGS